MPEFEAPCVDLGSVPESHSVVASPSPSEISSASSPEPPNVRATPLFRALAMPPPEPAQPQGQDELERRLPGYRRIVIPRELTLIELLKQCSGVTTDDEVLRIREAKLRVVAERVGLRRLHVLAPRLRSLDLDGSALSSLRDLGIGLVHLKILSVNRCGLSTLDGVWGLGALRELYAAGNRVRDLQPLAGLQKLHSLNLADNPISESTRLWTLGVCGALRRLTLSGTPASDMPDYRARVAAALPMLVYLDERPMHTDIEYGFDDSEGVLERASSSSESDTEAEIRALPKVNVRSVVNVPQQHDNVPGPSTSSKEENFTDTPAGVKGGEGNCDDLSLMTKRRLRRRPATTENAGARPVRPALPMRPRTAHDRPVIDGPTRLQILNTLMDDEWLCSGSKLTSHDPVCGNLARALRRTSSANQRRNIEVENELVEDTIEDAARTLAAEIPRVPRLEDWAKFKEETGIDIDIDFNQRPKCPDPSKILERLERIEKETSERYRQEKTNASEYTQRGAPILSNTPFASGSIPLMSDFELWSGPDIVPQFSLTGGSDTDMLMLFDDDNEMRSVSRERVRFPGHNDSQTE